MACQNRVRRGGPNCWCVPILYSTVRYNSTVYLLAHAIFETPATASEGVNKLHAHVFKGALLSATLKRRLDGLAKAAAAKKPKASVKPATQQKGTPAPNRASRLIVRNLPFDITEQDIRSIFLPYGPIYSVHIPLAADAKIEEGVTEDDV